MIESCILVEASKNAIFLDARSVINMNAFICYYRSQKFEDPAEGEEALVAKFKKLYDDLTAGFRNLEDETRWCTIM